VHMIAPISNNTQSGVPAKRLHALIPMLSHLETVISGRGISFWNIYFKLVQGAVRAPEVVAFLKALRRHLGDRKLLIVWDRLQAHRSRLVREYVESRCMST
jgi:hypothetical protein